jgi:hypothetical protein
MNPTSQPSQLYRFLGIAILVGFAALCCAGDASFTYFATSRGPTTAIAILLWAILGMMSAQACVLSVWLVLGDEPLQQRVALVSLAFLAAASSWALGGALTLDIDQSFNSQTEWKIVYFLGLIPVILLGLSIPLLIMRFFFSRRIARSSSPRAFAGKNSYRFSIGQLLILTTLIGIVGGGIEITKNLINPQVNHWVIGGVVTAYSLAVGLLVVVPFVIALLRQDRRSFWLFVLGVYVLLIGAAVIPIMELLDSNGRRWIPRRVTSLGAAIGLIVVFGAASLIVFLTGLRLAGFRLVKTNSPAAELFQIESKPST